MIRLQRNVPLARHTTIPSALGGALRKNLYFLSPDRQRTVYIGDLVE